MNLHALRIGPFSRVFVCVYFPSAMWIITLKSNREQFHLCNMSVLESDPFQVRFRRDYKYKMESIESQRFCRKPNHSRITAIYLCVFFIYFFFYRVIKISNPWWGGEDNIYFSRLSFTNDLYLPTDMILEVFEKFFRDAVKSECLSKTKFSSSFGLQN